MEPWILIAAIGGIGSSLNSFFNRLILRDGEDLTAFAWFYETVRTLFFLVWLIFTPIPHLSVRDVMWLVILGFLEFVSVIVWMRMFAFAELSVSTIIYRTRLIWIPIIAFFAFGEVLGLKSYLGILVLFIGLSVVVAPHKVKLDRGIKYSYLAAFLVSFLLIVMKQVSSINSIPLISAVMGIPSIILFPLMMKSSKSRLKKTFTQQIWFKIAAVAANIISVYCFFVAVRIGSVTIVNGISQAMMVVSVFLGITVLNEKKDVKRKIIGTAIALIGVILLS